MLRGEAPERPRTRERVPSRTLVVENLPRDAVEFDILRLFEGYGRILELSVGDGSAIVEFESRSAAEDAKRGVDGVGKLGKGGVLARVRFLPVFLVYRRGDERPLDLRVDGVVGGGGRGDVGGREYRTAEEQAEESRAQLEAARRRIAERKRLRFVHLDSKIESLKRRIKEVTE